VIVALSSRVLRRSLRSLLAALSVAACGCERWQSKGALDDARALSFGQALEYAERASAAYGTDASIRARFGEGTRLAIRDLPEVDVKAFVEVDPGRRVQWVAVRGTASLRDVKDDVEYREEPDPALGIRVHRGFYESATAVHDFVRPLLLRQYETRLTGHSLGGAVAAILMMMLQEDGQRLGRAITFGQPKVTNEQGVERYRRLPLLRVVNHDDPVPLLPPAVFLPGRGGGAYRHFGAEVWLLDDGNFRFFPEPVAQERDVTAFWTHLPEVNVTEHFIANYLRKLDEAAQRFPGPAPLPSAPP
jgi:triacylglycerol lipase